MQVQNFSDFWKSVILGPSNPETLHGQRRSHRSECIIVNYIHESSTVMQFKMHVVVCHPEAVVD
jgi:hypothetical protein